MDKKTFFLFLGSVLLASFLAASAKIIKNPSFEARKSSIVSIEEIDRGKDATRVKFHAVFHPKWWISFDREAVLVDPVSGQTFAPVSGEGITFDDKCWMPESGDTTFTVIYPHLPKNVKTLHFAPATNWATFGIDLTGKKNKAPVISDNISVAPHRPVSSFLAPGKVRIHGHINGYDERLDISEFKLYIYDLPIGESKPLLMEIDDDGNFDSEFYLPTPQTSFFTLKNGCFLSVYLEPENDLQIIIDWEDVLDVDRMRGLKDKMDNIKFGGSLGEINREIYFAPELNLPTPSYIMADNTPPLEAKDIISKAVADWAQEISEYADKNNLSPFSRRLLDNNVLSQEALDMLDYDMFRRDKRWQFPDSDEFKHPFPLEFYSGFMPRFLNADTSIIAADEMHIILNRLGFCGLPASLSGDMSYSQYTEEFTRDLCEYAGVDSLPFMWQLALAARQGHQVQSSARWNREFEREQLDELFAISLSDPYLRGRLDSVYYDVINFQPYELPDTEAGNLMRQLVAPYAGKWLLVDFWATSCGPCRVNIEQTKPFRDANRNNDSFDFLFITGEDESPEEIYNAYVSENLANDNVVRLPMNRHRQLRALFNISGIPHYVVIDPQGRVFDPDINNYDFLQHLRQENIPYVIPESRSAH